MSGEPRGGVARSHDGWWIAQVGVDFIRSDVLRCASEEAALFRWPGILGSYATEQEAESALRSELVRLGALSNQPTKRIFRPARRY